MGPFLRPPEGCKPPIVRRIYAPCFAPCGAAQAIMQAGATGGLRRLWGLSWARLHAHGTAQAQGRWFVSDPRE